MEFVIGVIGGGTNPLGNLKPSGRTVIGRDGLDDGVGDRRLIEGDRLSKRDSLGVLVPCNDRWKESAF